MELQIPQQVRRQRQSHRVGAWSHFALRCAASLGLLACLQACGGAEKSNATLPVAPDAAATQQDWSDQGADQQLALGKGKTQ